MSLVTPAQDRWDPIYSLREHGRHVLTSVEMTFTNLCNMRCEHCAVGNALTRSEGEHLPLEMVLRRLDEVEHLQTISITGGEPMFNEQTVRDTMVPLLRYAKQRGIQTQVNSNLTMPYERYELIAADVDVMHISFNYTDVHDFHRIGFARSEHQTSPGTAVKLYEQMIDNARRLSDGGLFVSAETMINYRTHRDLPRIHQLIAEMGCRRHEVHPMYPSDFAADLPVLSLTETREAIERLLDARDPDVWILFGTLPFYACGQQEKELQLLNRLRAEDNITIRNDPDGRNRLNVDLFSGGVYVTDFAELSSLGNIKEETLDDVFARWQQHPVFQAVNCHCPAADCCGPNWLVKNTYYKQVDFQTRQADIMHNVT